MKTLISTVTVAVLAFAAVPAAAKPTVPHGKHCVCKDAKCTQKECDFDCPEAKKAAPAPLASGKTCTPANHARN